MVRSAMLLFASCSLFLLVGCPTRSQYTAAGKEKVSAGFGISDQRILLESITDKITKDPALFSLVAGSRPTLVITGVKNKTAEHVDTESMTDSIKKTLLRRQLFTIVDRNNTNVLKQEQQLFQAGLSDAQTVVQVGKLWGARYALYGNFTSIEEWVHKRERQTYYKLTVIILDIETGAEVWIEDAEISKTTRVR